MKLDYVTQDRSVRVQIEYITGFPLKMTSYGKTYNRTTQAVLKINGFVKDFATVTRHSSDPDNLQYAYKLVTKKILKKLPSKSIRKEIWKQVLQKLDSDENSQYKQM